MENQKIKKNKLLAILTITGLLLIVFLIFGILFLKKEKKYEINNTPKEIEIESDFTEQKSDDNNKNSTTYTEYVNQNYHYSIKFPDNWHMNNDLSETKLAEKEVNDDGKKMIVGGQTFWSNYKNINDYSPQNKPDDFHIMGLTIYDDKSSKNIETFAKNIDFDDNSEKNPFEINGLKGIEFIATGLDSKNPRVAIIFQEDSLFYVFNLAFINGDKNVAEEMEKIVETFKFP